MITKDNLVWCFDNLAPAHIEAAMNSSNDYILFELIIFNIGALSYITSMDYSEEVEKEAHDNGQVFCDKDTFLQLFKDSNSTNEYLMKYL